jgi:hypothetical protein
MHFRPISEESRHELLALRDRTQRRGEECLSILLTGIDLYLSIGKEVELLEMMRDYADQMREAIEGTPSAKELEQLYHWNPEKEQE